MMLVTNLVPILKSNIGVVFGENNKFKNELNTIPAGHIFKVSAIGYMDMFLTSKEFDASISIAAFQFFFKNADIDI